MASEKFSKFAKKGTLIEEYIFGVIVIVGSIALLMSGNDWGWLVMIAGILYLLFARKINNFMWSIGRKK
ncbi:MAG: hypothetical protein WCG48_00130 [Candidatus Berkelbacteria bacterium]